MSSEAERPGGAPPPRGHGRRRLKRRLTIGAVFALALFALLYLLPSLFGPRAAAFARAQFGARYHGSLEIARVSLGWRSRQTVEGLRLLDPSGKEVARASIELPSLLELLPAARHFASERPLALGRVEILLEAEIEIDADGVSSADRALEPRAMPKDPSPDAPVPEERDERDEPEWPALLGRLELELRLRAPRLAWRDLRHGPDAAPLALREVDAELTLRPSAPLRLAARGVHELARPGTFELRASLAALAVQPAGVELGRMDARVALDGLAWEELCARFAVEAHARPLALALGPRLALELSAEGASAGGARALSAALDAGALQAKLAGALEGGVLRSTPDASFLDARFALTRALVAELAGPFLAPGAALELAPEGAELRLTVSELALSVTEELPLEGATLDAALVLGPLAYADPRLASAGVELALARAELRARLRPGAGASFELSADEGRGGAARIRAEGRLGAGWARALGAEGTGLLELELDARAEELPTRTADALAAQDGLLTDVLGERIALRLELRRLPDGAARLTARLASQLGSVDATASYAQGALRARGPGERLLARVTLSPLLSRRVVGPLLPVLVELKQAPGAAPIELSVSDYVLPLDGELARLDAKVGLALGAVRYRLLPGVGELLPPASALAQRSATLPPFQVGIAGGVARYDALPLAIDGRTYELKGSYDLARSRFDFDFSVPLAQLGGSVGRGFDAVRSYLPADLAVPLRLTGTLAKPSLSVRGDFLEKTLKDAAQKALQEQLQKGVQQELEKRLRDLLRRDG